MSAGSALPGQAPVAATQVDQGAGVALGFQVDLLDGAPDQEVVAGIRGSGQPAARPGEGTGQEGPVGGAGGRQAPEGPAQAGTGPREAVGQGPVILTQHVD